MKKYTVMGLILITLLGIGIVLSCEGPAGPAGPAGTAGSGLAWQGEAASPPSNPQEGWVYYNTADKTVYVYADAEWIAMVKDGADGDQGDQGLPGLFWQGNLSSHPEDPVQGWAYYNTLDNTIYIFHDGEWEILVKETYPDVNSLTFQILFTSDLHGSFYDRRYSTDATGNGLARTATYIKQYRTNKEDRTVLIDLGDAIQGNGTSVFHTQLWDEDSRNTMGLYPVIQGMQYLGYDAWVLGNHEFNFGLERLYKSYGKGQGPNGTNTFTGQVLAGNVYQNDEPIFDAFFVRQFGGSAGPRVAFISTTHPNSINWDGTKLRPDNVSIRPSDIVTAETIAWLKTPEAEAKYGGKIDIFIGASHIGSTSESPEGGDSVPEVIAASPDLTLLLSAHSHNNVDEMVKGVRHLRVSSDAATLGKVQIYTVRTANGWIVPDRQNDIAYEAVNTSFSAGAAADPGYLSYLQGANDFARDYTNTIIGELLGNDLIQSNIPLPFTNGSPPNARYYQYNALVHLINEAQLYYTQQWDVTLTANAPLNASANAYAGPLTRGDITGIYQYDNNTLCVLEMTGRQFKRWMEWAQQYWGEAMPEGTLPNRNSTGPAMTADDVSFPSGNSFNGYFADQFAGDVLYEVDLTQPLFSRIVNMRHKDGTPFDLDGVYRVATNDYRTSSQLSINAGEGSVYAIFPVGMEPATIVAVNVEVDLTVDGVTINNGEGMLGVMVDYINRVLGGVIDNTDDSWWTPTWDFVFPHYKTAVWDKFVRLVNAGNIDWRNDGSNWTAAEIEAMADVP